MDKLFELIIPLIFVAVAVVSSLLKKKKEKEERQMKEQTSAVPPREDDTEEATMYSASQDDIKAFLEQVSGVKPEEKPKPPPMPGQTAPAAKRKRKRKVSPAPRKALEAPRSSERIERRMPADAFLREAPEAQEIDMSGSIAHLPPMQQAILWREILGPPPGLPESRSERKD